MVTVRRNQGDRVSLLLEPNHSLPADIQAVLTFGIFVPALLTSFVFLMLGAWLVIPFIFAETALLGGALYWVRLRCEAREELLISGKGVAVRKQVGRLSQVWWFERAHLSLMLGVNEGSELRHVTLCGDGGLLEIGDFLNETDLKLLLGQLNQQGLPTKKHIQWGFLAC
ncbi:DUF2244 domain-containing protein [Pseudomaricurvus sp.]|uniref:DUF2244 domain-containing protein n=1 Tax=Pseudomaricurvus sp. TaxID=2004510 RepID=UPI003F6CD652